MKGEALKKKICCFRFPVRAYFKHACLIFFIVLVEKTRIYRYLYRMLQRKFVQESTINNNNKDRKYKIKNQHLTITIQVIIILKKHN